MIRKVTPTDAQLICAIYNHYVRNTIVTFEETPVSVAEMYSRIKEATRDFPWLVFEAGGKVVGYAYAGEWKSRCAYQHAVESSQTQALRELRGKGHSGNA